MRASASVSAPAAGWRAAISVILDGWWACLLSGCRSPLAVQLVSRPASAPLGAEAPRSMRALLRAGAGRHRGGHAWVIHKMAGNRCVGLSLVWCPAQQCMIPLAAIRDSWTVERRWATRLETRTKESNACASAGWFKPGAKWKRGVRSCSGRGGKDGSIQAPGSAPPADLDFFERFEQERIRRDPKDRELWATRTKPEETLVEVRSGTDVQIVRRSCL